MRRGIFYSPVVGEASHYINNIIMDPTISPNNNSILTETQFPSVPIKKLVIILLVVLLTILIVTFFAISITSDEYDFPLGRYILAVDPQTWAALGIAIAFTFSVIGAGWYTIWWPSTDYLLSLTFDFD